MKITVKNESIVKQQVDAIVNPANSFGYMGGGVADAIKQSGGTEIEEEAISNAPVEIGNALATTAGTLKCDFVIHAPTMRNPAEITYPWCIEDSTKAALKLADKMGLKKIAMPGMGAGVGEIPHKDAAKAMFKSINKFKPKNLEELILVDTSEEMIDAWNKHVK